MNDNDPDWLGFNVLPLDVLGPNYHVYGDGTTTFLMGDYRYTELSYRITSLISRTCCTTTFLICIDGGSILLHPPHVYVFKQTIFCSFKVVKTRTVNVTFWSFC